MEAHTSNPSTWETGASSDLEWEALCQKGGEGI